jgi:hypothetical protein
MAEDRIYMPLSRLNSMANPERVAPDAGDPHPQQAVPRGQLRAFSRGPLKDADLVAQSQVLQLEAARERKIENRVPKSVVRESSIGGQRMKQL